MILRKQLAVQGSFHELIIGEQNERICSVFRNIKITILNIYYSACFFSISFNCPSYSNILKIDLPKSIKI